MPEILNNNNQVGALGVPVYEKYQSAEPVEPPEDIKKKLLMMTDSYDVFAYVGNLFFKDKKITTVEHQGYFEWWKIHGPKKIPKEEREGYIPPVKPEGYEGVSSIPIGEASRTLYSQEQIEQARLDLQKSKEDIGEPPF